MSLIFSKLFPNHLDECGFIVDDLIFLILVKILWTIDCGGNKTINLLIKNSTFSLQCFLEDYKNRYKKFNEWTKVAETLQSEMAQVTVTFSSLQRRRNSSMRKHYERHIGIFSKSQKRLSLLHAQVNGKCPDFSHSPLKRNCSTKWIEKYDAVFVFKKFYPAVVGSLDQLSESRDGEVLGRAMPYLKAITTAGFLVNLEVINATLKLTKSVAKCYKASKNYFDCIRCYEYYQLQRCYLDF